MSRLSLSTLRRLVPLLLGLSLYCLVSGKSLPTQGGSIEGQWLIKVPQSQDAREVAASLGAIYIKKLKGVQGYHCVEFAKPLASNITDIEWRDQLAVRLESSVE